jgi:KDO2-lipid IV(A) lauroyltransferase
MKSSDQASVPLSRFWQPRYWGSWIALVFFWIVTKLPYKAAIYTGHFLGWLLYQIPGRRKRCAKTNIQLCLKDLSKEEQEKILKESFISMGIGMIEAFMCWWSLDKITRRCEVFGLENLQDTLDSGQGAVLLTCHMSTLEVGGTIINDYLPVAAMYRDQSNLLFNTIMVRSRQKNLSKVFHRNDALSLAKHLRRGQPVWYAPDQNYAGPQSVFADFFGIPASTTSGTTRLTRMTGAVVIPFYQIRQNDYSGYKVYIEKPLEGIPSDDMVADTTKINQAIEHMVLQAPGQYMWAHRRFKTRPNNEPSFY